MKKLVSQETCPICKGLIVLMYNRDKKIFERKCTRKALGHCVTFKVKRAKKPKGWNYE